MVRKARPLVAMIALAAAVLVAMSGGCGSQGNPNDLGDDASAGGGLGDVMGFIQGSTSGSSSGQTLTPGGSFQSTGDAGMKCPPGATLDCFVDHNCPGGAKTTITGKVYDPAGKNPLQNIVVFVPKDPATLPGIQPGTSTCSSCDTSIGDFVNFTFTGADGSFKLTDIPAGKNVPLVLQIGKWRRIMTVPEVGDCGTTQLPTSGTGQARLPRNHMEGDMPGMALLTGGLDDLGCFLTRMGIAAGEYTAPHGGGRLDVYQGLSIAGNAPTLTSGTAGNCTNTSCPLWASKQSFESYDIVLLACEGDTFDPDAQTDGGLGGLLGGGKSNVTKAAKQNLHDWLNEGGKVFATHFHYTWFQNGPPDFQAVANWKGYSLGTGMCNNCSIDQSFQGGRDFYSWLKTVGALSGTGINLTGVADSVGTVTMGTTDRWIYDSANNNDTKYLSFNLPIGGLTVDAGEMVTKEYCGKAVFTDLHAGGAPSGDLPGSCKTADLSAQEKALEYLFFDLSACVHQENEPPPPPIQPPK
jgi:hypothetical protein